MSYESYACIFKSPNQKHAADLLRLTHVPTYQNSPGHRPKGVRDPKLCFLFFTLRTMMRQIPKAPLLVLSCLILSCHILYCPFWSCLVLSCHVLSCPLLSCLVLSCLVLFCLVLSCPVVSYPCPCPVLSCILSWQHLTILEALGNSKAKQRQAKSKAKARQRQSKGKATTK